MNRKKSRRELRTGNQWMFRLITVPVVAVWLTITYIGFTDGEALVSEVHDEVRTVEITR